MGYRHVDNLYKSQEILLFKRCYAMEKIHGTSAHIKYNYPILPSEAEVPPRLTFFSGGVNRDNFISLFNQEELLNKFKELRHPTITVYGEAYGGKCQKMSKTYGLNLKFVAFEVQIGETWLAVHQAHDVCNKLGIEFVHYVEIPCELEYIDKERDADSVQAIRNGMGEGHKREGVVLRPLIEVTLNNGERVMAKHKRDEFKETNIPIDVDPNRRVELQDAQKVADNWVTEMRLDHVLDKMKAGGVIWDIKATPLVIKSMIEDVQRESEGIVAWNKDVAKAVGNNCRRLWMTRVKKICDPT